MDSLTSETESFTMSPSAAARVFAIPELLESILLELSNDSIRTCGGLVLQPAERIFGVIRVNRTFKATIEGSPQLRRLMGLQHCREKGYKLSWECAHYSHVQWLLDILCDGSTFNARGPHGNNSSRVVLESEHLHLSHGRQSVTYLLWRELYEELRQEKSCSWKEILVSPFADAAPLKLVVHLEFDCDDHVTDSVPVHWDFNAGDKLGDVFGLWSQLFDVLGQEVEPIDKLKTGGGEDDVDMFANAAQRVRLALVRTYDRQRAS